MITLKSQAETPQELLAKHFIPAEPWTFENFASLLLLNLDLSRVPKLAYTYGINETEAIRILNTQVFPQLISSFESWLKNEINKLIEPIKYQVRELKVKQRDYISDVMTIGSAKKVISDLREKFRLYRGSLEKYFRWADKFSQFIVGTNLEGEQTPPGLISILNSLLEESSLIGTDSLKQLYALSERCAFAHDVKTLLGGEVSQTEPELPKVIEEFKGGLSDIEQSGLFTYFSDKTVEDFGRLASRLVSVRNTDWKRVLDVLSKLTRLCDPFEKKFSTINEYFDTLVKKETLEKMIQEEKDPELLERIKKELREEEKTLSNLKGEIGGVENLESTIKESTSLLNELKNQLLAIYELHKNQYDTLQAILSEIESLFSIFESDIHKAAKEIEMKKKEKDSFQEKYSETKKKLNEFLDEVLNFLANYHTFLTLSPKLSGVSEDNIAKTLKILDEAYSLLTDTLSVVPTDPDLEALETFKALSVASPLFKVAKQICVRLSPFEAKKYDLLGDLWILDGNHLYRKVRAMDEFGFYVPVFYSEDSPFVIVEDQGEWKVVPTSQWVTISSNT